MKDDEKYAVNHSEEITCFVLTMDSLHVITGSRDMSLKVWQVAGGKLSQVIIKFFQISNTVIECCGSILNLRENR